MKPILWDTLEEIGMVRKKWVPDESFDDSFVECQGLSEEEVVVARKELWRQIDREGVWGLVLEYKVHPTLSKWEHGSSVWGLIGWDDGGYLEGLKEECISELKKSLQSRCPHCRQVR